MKKQLSITALLCLLVIAVWRCSAPKTETAASLVTKNLLPDDVNPACTISASEFATWFADGKVAINGLVTPANSVAFSVTRGNCDFYDWSEHMLLWLTSPIKGGGSVLESSLFYDVSASVDGRRRLVPHDAKTVLNMTSEINKTGPNGLPVIEDSNGRLLEIENADTITNAPVLVKSDKNSPREVASVQQDAGGALHFKDRNNNEIVHPKALIRHAVKENFVQRFKVGDHFVFLDANGKLTQSEVGQATGHVLMSKQGSLVYYLSSVNDVYAYFMTGVKNGELDSSSFPTTAATRDKIIAYARKSGHALPDSNALALEIKTSWVEAATLPDADKYFKVKATIPVYDTTSKIKWTPTGQKTVMMAMVGMHIVGSVAGHPEMIWATYEHNGITPNAAYDYITKDGKVATQPADTGTGWVFSTNAADTAVNIPHMGNRDAQRVTTPYITAQAGHTISSSNTQRIFAWGAFGIANPRSKSAAASNTELISINKTIETLLSQGDVRANYLLIGATWTEKGAAPNGKSYSAEFQVPGAAVGTNVLANSTMETYFQTSSKSCFTCHSNSKAPGVLPTDLSHYFKSLQPMVTANAMRKQ
ncbi:hypothetical protein GWR56_03595 [Mucilaginibacter sp. 14171R-50]|uniref:hypothetical protein n=1 Tax=Mucilaginibacter sp. 14171R-50 TaxID=2703789 RepID=UPI00138BA1E8|nr:hypothetical protein [Mucilaginibacter sp. 14171R-50]QHS54671.1 hypothetical protein GWR56_03595 [Mucilaginibacter sp. 14171R-50]